MTTVQLAEHQMIVDLLGRVKAGAIRGGRRVKSDLDPMKSTSIVLRLAVRINRQILPDDNIAATKQLGERARRVGVAARVILADGAARDALVLVDHLPLEVLAAVSVEDTLRGHLLRDLLAHVVQAATRRRLGQRVAAHLFLLLLCSEEPPELGYVGVLALCGCACPCARSGVLVSGVSSLAEWAGLFGWSSRVAGFTETVLVRGCTI